MECEDVANAFDMLVASTNYCDDVVFCLGFEEGYEREGADRKDLLLPGNQVRVGISEILSGEREFTNLKEIAGRNLRNFHPTIK